MAGFDVSNSEQSQKPEEGPRLHRLGEVRKRRKLSVADVAQKLQLNPEDVKQQEQATTDLTLSLLYHTKQIAIRRMAHTLVDQLVELAPELKPIAAAHSAGQQQLFDEQGRALKGTLPVDFFLEPIE